jgi:uncharacterized protein with gpF-like domain
VTPIEAAFISRLERQARQLSPELVRRYLEAYRLIRGVLSEAEIVRAIRSGSVERLIATMLDDEALDPAVVRLRVALDRAVLQVAETEARHFPSWVRPAAFDILSPQVIEAARRLDQVQARLLKDQVRDTLRTVVVEGIEAGRNPRAVARQVKSLVGLSESQAQAVLNFRRQLETGDRAALRRALGKGVLRRPDGSTIVRRAHAGGEGLTKAQLARLDRLLGKEPLSAAQVDAMVEAYRKRLEAWNVETQTRTAMLQAQKQGQRASWEDAIARGVVQRWDLARSWVAVGGPKGDGRNRPEHLILHGTVVGFDEPFPNGDLIPGETDYNCRCRERVFIRRMRRAA